MKGTIPLDVLLAMRAAFEADMAQSDSDVLDMADSPLQSPIGAGCYRTRPCPNSDGG